MKRTTHLLPVLLATTFAAPPLAGRASAQSVLVQAAWEQAFAAPEEWEAPRGGAFGVGVGGLPGGLALRVSLRSLSEEGTALDRVCNFASCVDGPFSTTYTLRTFGLGLSRELTRIASFDLVLSVDASVVRQAQELEGTDGRHTTRGSVRDYGLGPGLAVLLPPIGARLRPVLYGRYDRVFAGGCDADAACYGDRGVSTIGLGIAVVLR